MFGMSTSVGIDLGTANVLVYVKGKGIVLREPSVVTVDRDTDTVLAIGEEAREMIGRTPGNIVANYVHPRLMRLQTGNTGKQGTHHNKSLLLLFSKGQTYDVPCHKLELHSTEFKLT